MWTRAPCAHARARLACRAARHVVVCRTRTAADAGGTEAGAGAGQGSVAACYTRPLRWPPPPQQRCLPLSGCHGAGGNAVRLAAATSGGLEVPKEAAAGPAQQQRPAGHECIHGMGRYGSACTALKSRWPLRLLCSRSFIGCGWVLDWAVADGLLFPWQGLRAGVLLWARRVWCPSALLYVPAAGLPACIPAASL